MQMTHIRWLTALLLLAPVSCSPLDKARGSQVIVLKGATVVDGTGSPPKTNAVVVLQDGRILDVVDAGGDESYPDGASVVDLKGRYIVPGFIETHAHPPPDSKARPETIPAVMRTLLAFGITTIRNPGARPGAGVELRDRINSGDLLGPRVLTAGPLIDAPPSSGQLDPDWAYVETEAQVRAEVRRQQASGVDLIKLYCGLEPALVSAAIDESHRLGLSVIGHLCATSWLQAAGTGIDGLVHSFPLMIHELPRGGLQPSVRGPYVGWAGIFANMKGEYYRSWRESFHLDSAEMEALISALIDNDVEINPTLVLSEALLWGDDLNYLQRMEPWLAPERDVPGWWGDWRERNPYTADWSAQDFAEARRAFAMILGFVKTLHERGVLITAGSDMGNAWMTPGVSFHRELELLVQAGISPLDVLKIATKNGAEALGILDDLGTIEPGKRGDLVVLTANPVLDIRNTRSIEAVYVNGRQFKPASLLNP